MTKGLLFVLAAATVCFASLPANAQTLVYDNGVASGGGPGLTTQLVAHDFTLSAAQTIGRVRFWSLDGTAYGPGFSDFIYWAIHTHDGAT